MQAIRVGRGGTVTGPTIKASESPRRKTRSCEKWTGFPEGNDGLFSFGIKRLTSGRWCLFRSAQGSFDEGGRPDLISAHAFVIGDYKDLQ